jgi:putative glycosyl hydrolase
MSGHLPDDWPRRSDLASSIAAWAASQRRLRFKAVARLRSRTIIAISVAIAICVAAGTFAAVYGFPNPASRPLKGVGTWNVSGAGQALSESNATWYYSWRATPEGITAPSGVSFVPMIWGASNVTASTLNVVKREGHILLGFNEPDISNQADMSVKQALVLWPKLMATGMTLGSPAVSSGAATPGGWLDQFMKGAAARGYRVNFIALHWYGTDFRVGPAVLGLQDYLRAVYDRYHLPIWLTEFALANFKNPTPTFPTAADEATFLTQATRMLSGLPYVQRYAWFALPVASPSGTAGLFNLGSSPVATEVGRAFASA